MTAGCSSQEPQAAVLHARVLSLRARCKTSSFVGFHRRTLVGRAVCRQQTCQERPGPSVAMQGASLQCERPGQGNMCQHQRAPAILASPAEDSWHVLHLQASFTGHRAYHSYHDSTPYVHTAHWPCLRARLSSMKGFFPSGSCLSFLV